MTNIISLIIVGSLLLPFVVSLIFPNNFLEKWNIKISFFLMLSAITTAIVIFFGGLLYASNNDEDAFDNGTPPSTARESDEDTSETPPPGSTLVIPPPFNNQSPSGDDEAPLTGAESDEIHTCSIWLSPSASNARSLDSANSRREVWSVAFSDDGKLVASGEGSVTPNRGDLGRIRVWSTIEDDSYSLFDQIGEDLDDNANPVRSVVFLPNSHNIVSGHHVGQIALWSRTDDGNSWDYKLIAPTEEIEEKENTSASPAEAEEELQEEPEEETRAERTPHSGPVISLAISPNGTLLASGSIDGKIALWQLTNGEPNLTHWLVLNTEGIQILTDNSLDSNDISDDDTRYEIVKLGFSSDSNFLVFSYKDNFKQDDERSNYLAVYDVRNRSLVYEEEAEDTADPVHRDRIEGIAFVKNHNTFASDNTFASGSLTGEPEIIIWQVSQQGNLQKQRHFPDDNPPGIRSLDFCSDSSVLASVGEGSSVILRDIDKGDFNLVGENDAGRIHSVQFSPDGRLLATGSSDGNVIVHYIPQ